MKKSTFLIFFLFCFSAVGIWAAGAVESARNLLSVEANEVLYSESFDTESSLDGFTILDGNNDGRTWSYYSSKKLVQYWGGDEADEWLFMPEMNLEAGTNYKLRFKTGLENAVSEKQYKDLMVTIGREATVEAQTVQLFRDTIQSALMEEKSAVFSVTESGSYRIGFHCLGQTSYYAIFIDDIVLGETEVVPAAVTDLAVTPGEQGALSATVTWTNPSLSAAGTSLPGLTKMELYRGATLIYTQEAPVMGEVEQVVDDEVPAPGRYEYSVIGYVEGNAGGAAVEESGWIGFDVPCPVTDVVLTDVEGRPRIDFKAPVGGVNGGYIDREALTYRVVRNPGNEMLTEMLTDTCYIDEDELSLALYSYTVTALSGETESEPATSNALIFGGALSLPYETEMATADEMALWTIVDANNDGKSWVYKNQEMSYTAYSAADDWLFTPPFVAGEGSHTLKFRVRAYSYRYPESMEVTIAPNPAADVEQKVIASYPEINSTLSELYSADFQVPEAGVWYVGFHITSPDPWGLYLSYCSIISNVVSGIDTPEHTEKVYFDRETQSLILDETADLCIVDLSGAMLLTRQSVSGSLDLSQLPAGLYIARAVIGGTKTIQVKFIK